MKKKTVGQAALWVLVLVAVLPGCAGYRLGSMLPPGIRSVSVPIAENRTSEPMIENEITRAIIAEIQRDGSLRLLPSNEADAELRVTIRHHEMTPITFRTDTRSEPDEYRLRVEAEFQLVRTGSDEIIAEHPAAVGESTVRLAGNFGFAKQVALPEAARDLARDIVRKLVEYW
jgi:hypothetical protein